MINRKYAKQGGLFVLCNLTDFILATEHFKKKLCLLFNEKHLLNIAFSFHIRGQCNKTAFNSFCLVFPSSRVSPLKFDIDEGATRISFSPDGKFLASAGEDSNTINLWSTTDGALVKSFPPCDEAFSTLTFSPDGALIAAYADSATLLIYSVENEEVIWSRENAEDDCGYMTGLVFTQNCQTFISVDDAGLIRWWDMEAIECNSKFRHTSPFISVALSKDENVLAAAEKFSILLLNSKKKQLLRVIGRETHCYEMGLKFSNDCKALLSGGMGQPISIWDVSTGACLKTMRTKNNSCYRCFKSVAFSPDDKLIASCENHTIVLWDACSGKKLHQYKNTDNNGRCFSIVTFSNDSNMLAALSDDKIKIWIP